MTASGVRLPARVNPLLVHPHERRRCLDRGWRFRLDPDDRGVAERWFGAPDRITEPIEVPGSWQGQGFGHDGTDEVWDFRLRARVFRATYRGTGWYALTLRAPDDWAGCRLWLSFGGAHPSAEAWLNGEPLGCHAMPFVPFGFEVTGRLRFAADNDLVVRIHEANRLYGLAYNWQGNWSGLYRGVELSATGATGLSEVHLLPDVDGEVLRLRAWTDRAMPGQVLRVAVRPADQAGPVIEAEVPVADGIADGAVAIPGPRLWSPDQPDLYRVEVALADGAAVLDALTERTGFVKLTADGRRFLIDGEPYYVRGTGDFLSCPETGCPDTDRQRWRCKLQALRDYGYNQVRCQSYVYAPEYFDVADEVGLLIQSEMGMLGGWGGQSPEHGYAWPLPTPDHAPVLKAQWDLVVRRDASHPSACLYCMSNELGHQTPFAQTAWRCYRDTKAIKPHSMVIWTDGGYSPELPGDFVNTNWPAGQAFCDRPVIEHEYRWWSSFPDVRLASRYTGAVRPYAADLARAVAGDRGQAELLPTYAANSQQLQLLEMKAKLEQLRRDRPELAGVSHFNAMDANPSPQGVLTEFYEPKLADAATWLQTNGDTVILADLNFDDRVLAGGETFGCRLSVSDFGHPPCVSPRLTWRLVRDGEELAGGELTWSHEPFTTCPAGEAAACLPVVDEPCRVQLQAELHDGGRVADNAWDLWLFPTTGALPAGVARHGDGGATWVAQWSSLPPATGASTVWLTDAFDAEVLAFVASGGTAILAAGEGLVRPHAPNFGYVRYFFCPPANYGPFEDGQNGTVILDHPLLGRFPHEGYASWPFYRLIDSSPPLDLAPLDLADPPPVVRVIHRYPVLHPLGYLTERAVGAGRLVLTAFRLDPAWPEARYLLAAICDYLANADRPPASPASALMLSRLAAAAGLVRERG